MKSLNYGRPDHVVLNLEQVLRICQWAAGPILVTDNNEKTLKATLEGDVCVVFQKSRGI